MCNMALIAALLPKEADRSALGAATPGHGPIWASTWRDLDQVIKREPVAAAVVDLRAEPGKDGVLRVYRLASRYPLTPIIAWGALDGRDLLRLGKAGVTDVILAEEAANTDLVAEVMDGVTRDVMADRLDERLGDLVDPEARALVRSATVRIPDGVQVPAFAAANGMSVSTLERRCERWGLPTPGHLLLWLRILYGLRWLMEPGRSVESVASQLGYSSGAAFRRAIKVTVGGRPSPLRNEESFEEAIEAFLAACPGEAMVHAGTED
jgi:AraC-like DNA-binding protein